MDRIEARLSIGTDTSPIIDLKALKAMIGKKSDSAAHRWLDTYAPRARCGNGRYRVTAIQAGLAAEGRRIV